MKVGDRIRVFEVQKSFYSLEENIIGLQRPEIGYFDGGGADIYLTDKSGLPCLFFNTNNTSSNTQAKHVCTMVITKLK